MCKPGFTSEPWGWVAWIPASRFPLAERNEFTQLFTNFPIISRLPGSGGYLLLRRYIWNDTGEIFQFFKLLNHEWRNINRLWIASVQNKYMTEQDMTYTVSSKRKRAKLGEGSMVRAGWLCNGWPKWVVARREIGTFLLHEPAKQDNYANLCYWHSL